MMTGHNKPRWFVTMSWLGVGGCCWPAAPGGPQTFLCNLLRERERQLLCRMTLVKPDYFLPTAELMPSPDLI